MLILKLSGAAQVNKFSTAFIVGLLIEFDFQIEQQDLYLATPYLKCLYLKGVSTIVYPTSLLCPNILCNLLTICFQYITFY